MKHNRRASLEQALPLDIVGGLQVELRLVGNKLFKDAMKKKKKEEEEEKKKNLPEAVGKVTRRRI